MMWNKIIQFVLKEWKAIVICAISIMSVILISQMKINWRLLILHDAERVTVKIK